MQKWVKDGADKDWGGNGRTPLREAAIVGHLDVVKYLVEAGADKDSVDSSGVPLSP